MHSAYWFTLFIYFATHIPITLLVDMQVPLFPLFSSLTFPPPFRTVSKAVFPSLYPEALTQVMDYHVTTFKDFMMADPQPWLRSIIACEMLFQLPFFFYAVWALLAKANSARIPFILYGTHVTTTLVPILGEVYYREGMEVADKVKLSLVYLPYLLIPLSITVYFSLATKPFGDKAKTN